MRLAQAVVISGILLVNAGTSAAAESADKPSVKPWEFTGSLTLRGTSEKGVGSDIDYRLNLTATKELQPNLTFKTTLTSFREKKFPTSEYPSKDFLIDQYSLKYALTDQKSSLLIGKDDMLFGNGLLVGDNLKSITFATAVDKLNIQISTFKNKYVPADIASSVGGTVQTSCGKLSFGASYIKQNDGGYRNWAVNGSYPIGGVKLGAEYTENMAADPAQKAYYLTATYGGLKHKGDSRLTVGYVKAEKNALPPYTLLNLTNAREYRGTTLAVGYQVTEKSALTFEYNHLRSMADSNVSRTRLAYNLTF